MHQLTSRMVVITSGLPQAIGEGMNLNNRTNTMSLKPHLWCVRMYVRMQGF